MHPFTVNKIEFILNKLIITAQFKELGKEAQVQFMLHPKTYKKRGLPWYIEKAKETFSRLLVSN
jgi:hypothetical protein